MNWMTAYPLDENPCLHRFFGTMPNRIQFSRFASEYGLLVAIPAAPAETLRAIVFGEGEEVQSLGGGIEGSRKMHQPFGTMLRRTMKLR